MVIFNFPAIGLSPPTIGLFIFALPGILSSDIPLPRLVIGRPLISSRKLPLKSQISAGA